MGVEVEVAPGASREGQSIQRVQTVSDAFDGAAEVVSFKGSDPKQVLDTGPAPHGLHFSGAGYDSSDDALVAMQRRTRDAALLSTTGEFQSPRPLDAASLTVGRPSIGEPPPTVRLEQVTIVPTPYPENPAAPLAVRSLVHIDVRSVEFREFRHKT